MHITFLSRKRVLIFVAITVVIGTSLGASLLMWWSRPYTSCYYSWYGDVLPSAKDLSFSPDIRTIFFHVTSCEGLEPRQACAIEAAARTNEQWQVYVLFSAPVTHDTLKTSCLAGLINYSHNVNFARVHMEEYSKETDAQSILLNDLDRSKHPVAHAADLLKMVTLDKWGGIYLDTDMIVTRSLEELPMNFVTKADDDSVSAAVLSFANDDVGNELTTKIIRLMSYKRNFNENELSYLAPILNTVINDMCPNLVQSLFYATGTMNTCKDLTIYGNFYFRDVREIFQAFSLGENVTERPYIYRMTSDFYADEHSPHSENMLKIFCPNIYYAYPKEFLNRPNPKDHIIKPKT